MFKFITNKPLWVNIVAAIVLALMILLLFLKMLGLITKHGAYLKVPAVTGLKTDAAINLLQKEGFEVYIQDSVFTDTTGRGIVLKQLPDPNALVKINRTVFLTVNRYVPPMLEMPNLEGQNLTFAIGTLLRNHLKLGDTTFRPDFAVGSVLEQQYNGVRIPAKSKIQWGSKIDLVIAGGLEDREIPVPSLTGLSYAEAKSLLESEGITLGAIISDGRIIDTSNAFIIKQRPDRFDVDRRLMYIRSGQLMDVWISQEMKTLASDSIAKMKNKEQ